MKNYAGLIVYRVAGVPQGLPSKHFGCAKRLCNEALSLARPLRRRRRVTSSGRFAATSPSTVVTLGDGLPENLTYALALS